MTARRRIIISLIAMVLLVAVVLLVFIILNTGRLQQSGDELLVDMDDNVKESVRQELLSLAHNISGYVIALESEIEGNMRNAANTVYEADRLSGFSLTLEDLEQLRERTGMSDLYLGGTDGIFTLSTEPGGAGVSLFDIWEGYRAIVTGEADFMTAPLSMKVETGEIFKFAIIPRADNMGIIESALEAGAVELHLQSFIEADYGIRSMNLFAADLLTLTENHMEGVQPGYTKGGYLPSSSMRLGSFFDGSLAFSIVFDEHTAQIYYPVSDGTRVCYVLFIDMDTTGYFSLNEHISEVVTGQVQQSTTFNTISLIVVLAVLLIFTVIIVILINRIMLSYEEQNELIEQRTQAVMDNERLVRYHTIILLCVGVFFAAVQGPIYGASAAIVIMAAVTTLAAFMFLSRRAVPLNIRIHIISNGSFFVALGCSLAITSTPDMFGLYLTCVIVSSLYFRKSVIAGMAITVNASIIVFILLLRMGLPEGFEFTTMWFLNNMAALNCGIALLYAVSSIGKGFIDNITFKSQETEELLSKVQAQSDTIMDGINYAGKIQSNLLPQDSALSSAFSDFSAIWKPRDVVGGDIYWHRRFEKGEVLCVADCTGHGTPGALLTMLVVSLLESIVRTSNCDDTADIVYKLDQKLSQALHVETAGEDKRDISDIDDGCDIAVLFVAKDGSIKFSGGKIPIFICDGNEVKRLKGQKIFVGEGKLGSKDDVEIVDIPANPVSKYYIASDGMYDQVGAPGSRKKQFGYDVFKKIILENHAEKQSVITAKVWEAFDSYRGDEAQRDDFVLVAFKP